MYTFPDISEFKDHEEVVFIFETSIPVDKPLQLASNYEYELWMSTNNDSNYIFSGCGGYRCCEGQAYIDIWNLNHHIYATNNIKIQIRYHWLNINLSSVWYRCLFKTPFLYYMDETIEWQCYYDSSYNFGAKMASQLARQNIISLCPDNRKPVALQFLSIYWDIQDYPVKPLNHILVSPKLITSGILKVSPKNTNNSDPDVVKLIMYPEKPLRYDTYDLGYLALHKFILPPGIYYYTQIPEFRKVWDDSNQKKVHLGDIVHTLGSPIGYRGCRYLHVFYETPPDSTLFKIFRAEYPFNWKSFEHNPLISAVKNNLIACVDGGYVDCCWRERACWTGDARMMAKAVKTLTNNEELTPFVLTQIADSYDHKTGMVNGCWPTKDPNFKIPMATYHLAWCLAVVENHVDDLKPLVIKSIDHWKEHYLVKGLISHYPGWTFVDWDFTDPNTIGQVFNNALPHCVVNSWWIELCTQLDIPSEICPRLFDKIFWTGIGYSLAPGLPPSIHATAAVLSANFTKYEGFLLHPEANKFLKFTDYRGKVTAYFAYFIAKALKGNDRKTFIDKYYGPIAKKYNTIFEKHDGTASLAHGWSVGFIELIGTI